MTQYISRSPLLVLFLFLSLAGSATRADIVSLSGGPSTVWSTGDIPVTATGRSTFLNWVAYSTHGKNGLSTMLESGLEYTHRTYTDFPRYGWAWMASESASILLGDSVSFGL